MYDAAFTKDEEDAYKNNYLLLMTICFESFFIIDLILKFFTEIKSDDFQIRKERNLSVIAQTYISKGTFYWDLIPIIPL